MLDRGQACATCASCCLSVCPGTHCEEPGGSHKGVDQGGEKHQGEAGEQETCRERAGS